MKSPVSRLLVMSAVMALSITACSSGDGELTVVDSNVEFNIEDGWDWMIRSDAAWDLGVDFNSRTGELTWPDGDNESPEALQRALDEATQHRCERYVEGSYADSVLEAQGWAIRDLLRGAHAVVMADEYSDAYRDAVAAANQWVDNNGPDPDDYEIATDEYFAALDERSELLVSHLDSEYPELKDERTAIDLLNVELYRAAFTPATVRAAQEQYISACDLHMPDDYEFPTPEELGINLSDSDS